MNIYSISLIRFKFLSITVLLITVCLLPFQLAYPQAQTPNDNHDETFLLNLKNVDIRSLIETVSSRTGKNFIVDPRVKATVTMISSKPINQEKLYEIFLSVLEVHGYAAVTSGAVIKIVPSTVGTQSAIPVLNDSADSRAELISRVIVLQSMPAQQMVETLRPLLPQSASIEAESNTDTIVVTDQAGNIEKLIALIELMDRN